MALVGRSTLCHESLIIHTELPQLVCNFAPSSQTHLMSDAIKHECGLAYIRLRKPFSYYLQKHGSVMYGLSKLYLLMEKQHNRGQDGAGLAVVKLDTQPGSPFCTACAAMHSNP